MRSVRRDIDRQIGCVGKQLPLHLPLIVCPWAVPFAGYEVDFTNDQL
jgi:hypothetical protein